MRVLALSACFIVFSACGGEAPPEAPTPDAAGETASGDVGFGGEVRGTVDAVATNRSGEVEVGVTDEVMFFRLTEQARNEVRKEIDEETPEDGLGATIGDLVSGVVNQALATTVQIDLHDIDDVRYENGRLVVEADESGPNVSVSGHDGDDGLEFDAEDAQRIVDAYRRNR